MARNNPNKKDDETIKITVSINKNILNEFDDKIMDSGLDRSKMIELLIRTYLTIDPEEMKDWKSKLEILFETQLKNGNK